MRALLLLCLSLYTFAAGAAEATNWVEGTHYFRVQAVQPVAVPGKIEVLEVFSYACPACNAFQPTLKKIAAALPPEARMAYLPAAFNPDEDWPVFQRAFLTAQTLNIADKAHDAMYEAIWSKSGSLRVSDAASNHPLPKSQQPAIEDVARFYARYGVKADEFVGVAKSFAVDAQISRADAALPVYGVDSTPTLIINGKYRLTPRSAGGYEQTIALVQYLVAREKALK